MKLTASTVRTLALPEGKSDHIFFCENLSGFGLRVRASGARAFYVQYAVGGRTRRMRLGSTTLLDLGEAREKAREILAKVRLGTDPAAERAESRSRAGETFGALAQRYLDRRRNDPKLRLRSLAEIERHLTRNLKALYPLRIDAVTRRAIATELTRLTDENGPSEANRTRASVSKFLDWCAGEGFIDVNPAQYTNVNPEAARDRVLSMVELAIIWRALPAGDFGDIVKLLMLVGARAREIGELHWDELDERSTIVIPASRSKNRRAHTIHLVPAAAAILRAREQTTAHGPVFGRGKRGFNGWGRSKRQLDAKVKLAAGWVVHDIRRAVATHMGELGVLPHVIESCLNHISGTKSGVAGIYNRARHEIEKGDAWALWATHLLAAVDGVESNVTPLRRA
jgi:integrase